MNRQAILLESYKLYMDRLNSELSVHWTRINIGVVALTAALGGYGALWQKALTECKTIHLYPMIAIVGLLIVLLACLVRRVLLAGKNWCDIAEVRVVAIERELISVRGERSIYMCHEYDGSWKSKLRMHPTITSSYNNLLIAIILLLVLTSSVALFLAFAEPCIVSSTTAPFNRYASVIAGNWNVLLALFIVTIPAVAVECYFECCRTSKCLRKADCERKIAIRKMTHEVQAMLKASANIETSLGENEKADPSACTCICHECRCSSSCS
jgi:hypothetical protein